jgi:hypothetical protein
MFSGEKLLFGAATSRSQEFERFSRLQSLRFPPVVFCYHLAHAFRDLLCDNDRAEVFPIFIVVLIVQTFKDFFRGFSREDVS